MCAVKKHDVPLFHAVEASVMRAWMEERVVGTACQRAACFSFGSQPASMSGQRRTSFPFLKFYLAGEAHVQDATGAVVSVTRPGDLTVFTAESWANVQFTGPVSFLRVTLLPQETFIAFNEIMRIQPGDHGPREEQVTAYVLKGAPSRLIRELWNRLERWPLPLDRALAWQLMLCEWCHSLEAEALKVPDTASKRRYTRRSEVMDYLEANAHRLINRQSVSEAMGMSPGELSRLFQRTGEETFTETLNRIRLEHAKSWLRREGVSVADVAARCGFSSANYFAQVFRQFEGVSPLNWKAGER